MDGVVGLKCDKIALSSYLVQRPDGRVPAADLIDARFCDSIASSSLSNENRLSNAPPFAGRRG